MKKLGLLVVIAVIALAFAMPAFAECGCGKCSTPCPKPCVTCSKPCNPLQATADKISCVQRPCQKCTFVNPVTRVAETICPGQGKEKNMLKPWYSCEPCKPCAKPCATPCAKPCSTCSK